MLAYLQERHEEWLGLYGARRAAGDGSGRAGVAAVFDAYADHANAAYVHGFRGCGLLNAAAELPSGAPGREQVRRHKAEVQQLRRHRTALRAQGPTLALSAAAVAVFPPRLLLLDAPQWRRRRHSRHHRLRPARRCTRRTSRGRHAPLPPVGRRDRPRPPGRHRSGLLARRPGRRRPRRSRCRRGRRVGPRRQHRPARRGDLRPLLLGCCPGHPDRHPEPRRDGRVNLAVVTYLALVPMFLGYVLLGRGLASVGASTATTLSLAEPGAAVVIAVLALLLAGLVTTTAPGRGAVAG